ncbi:MAG: hypothetical protein V1810_02580 [Candidatus Beckwithbacteria bacterium]
MPERIPQEIISISQQSEGDEFVDFSPVFGEITQYLTRVILRSVGHNDDIFNRCNNALLLESGVYLEYSGLKDGMKRRVRIVNCEKITIGNQNLQADDEALMLTLILSEADYIDFNCNDLGLTPT